MTIKIFIFSLLQTISFYGYAQNKQLSIKIIDSVTSEPLSDIIIFMENSDCYARTDSNGLGVFSPECLKSKSICFIVRAPFVRKKFCLSTSSNYNATFIIPISTEEFRKTKKLLPDWIRRLSVNVLDGGQPRRCIKLVDGTLKSLKMQRIWEKIGICEKDNLDYIQHLNRRTIIDSLSIHVEGNVLYGRLFIPFRLFRHFFIYNLPRKEGFKG